NTRTEKSAIELQGTTRRIRDGIIIKFSQEPAGGAHTAVNLREPIDAIETVFDDSLILLIKAKGIGSYRATPTVALQKFRANAWLNAGHQLAAGIEHKRTRLAVLWTFDA